MVVVSLVAVILVGATAQVVSDFKSRSKIQPVDPMTEMFTPAVADYWVHLAGI